MTKNGELFSSTFDLIIYFCVVEFVQIWGAVKAHCQITSSLPFFKVFFVSPPLPKYKRTFNTRTNPAPLLLSGAGHVDVFNDVDGGGVDDYCSYVFGLLLFYFNSFSFFIYIKDSLVQSSLEQREEKGRGKKSKQERLLRAHVHSRNHKQKKSLPLTRFLVAFDAPVLSVQKKKPHTERHTHTRTDRRRGRSKAGARQLVVPN